MRSASYLSWRGVHLSKFLLLAVAGLLVSVGLATVWIMVGARLVSPQLTSFLSYAVVWAPCGIALLWAYRGGQRSWKNQFGFSFAAIDIAWGIGIGVLARVSGAVIENVFLGRPYFLGAESASFSAVLLVGMLVPVVCAPVIEELFFRGLLLRGLIEQGRLVGGNYRVSAAAGILLSALIFGAVHIVGLPAGTYATVVFSYTAILGLGLALVATLTGRLGGAIIAHATYNFLVLTPGLI